MSGSSVQEVKLFAGLEADCLSGDDADFGSGARVASNAGFAGLHGEDAEAAQFDAIAREHALLHAFEDGVHGGFSLDAGEAGAFYDPLDEVLFDH